MTILKSHATAPEVRGVSKVVSKYLKKHARDLSPTQKEAGIELKRRINRLENDCNRLIKINNWLLDNEGLEAAFDQSSDTLTFSYKGKSVSIKLNRAVPAVPFIIPDTVATSGYKTSVLKEGLDTSHVDELKMVMEQMLEHYYSNAFRITKLVQQITNRKKYHCRPITMVRNKLVEHPEPGSIYSFGFGSNGPLVKPMHRGTTGWRDAGLVPNTIELVSSLNSVFENDT